jgi:O-succinylbenzoic acid--CoA ligase
MQSCCAMAMGSITERHRLSWPPREEALLVNPRWPRPWLEAIRRADFPRLRGHVWIATSGTGGRLKLVALSRDALEVGALAVNHHLEVAPRDVWLNVLPFFHVGGLAMAVRAHLSGARHEVFGMRWHTAEFVRSAEAVGATLSALVPTQVHDLIESRCCPPRALRAVVVGGGALDAKLRDEAMSLGWPLLPSYGLTEAASQVATAHPGQADREWLPLLGHVEARTDENGVLQLRSTSLLAGWMIFDEAGSCSWEDPKRDGWYHTNDRAELRGREVRILGRVDDLVKIRGELVDLGLLERALQARVLSGAVIIRSRADRRNGAALQVTAENEAAAREARTAQEDVFPPYARPEEISAGRIERTALGKLVRAHPFGQRASAVEGGA